MNFAKHKLLSFEQVSYLPRVDRHVTFAEGLDAQHAQGWELVTSFPSGSAPGALTLFVFRRFDKGAA